MRKEYFKTLTKSLAFSICGLLFATSAQAAMVSTDEVVSSQANNQAVQVTVAREQVKQVLLKHGVKSENIEQRLNQLTPQELQQLASKFEELPAAGVGGVLLLSGAVSLMLEMSGVTDLTTTF